MNERFLVPVGKAVVWIVILLISVMLGWGLGLVLIETIRARGVIGFSIAATVTILFLPTTMAVLAGASEEYEIFDRLNYIFGAILLLGFGVWCLGTWEHREYAITEGMVVVFCLSALIASQERGEVTERLREEIRRLKMEVDWLNKKL